jgi:AcrR family transcriptional regulator
MYMPAEIEVAPDHRTRVAAEKRVKMRRRLVESAMLVFAEKGVDASVIDDVIAAAAVSRGSFYHYFRTNAELLAATSEELANELITAIEERVGNFEDPAKRLACGMRLYLHTARKYPLLAGFVSRAGFDVNSPSNRFNDYLPRHITEGIELGKFRPMQLEAALDIVAGAGLVALFRLTAPETKPDYPEQIVAAMLRGLGVKETKISTLMSLDIEPLVLPPDSLLERSHVRYTLS